ncbi:MAG: hypothetical protein K0R78_3121 [Pelosinus sp.]|nr:hypothetical protein [Pelosinus sp.]
MKGVDRMTKKRDGQATKILPGTRQDKGKVYVDELYFRHVDQMDRWRQEYDHCQMVENTLAAISNFNYEEVDYTSLLIRKPWKERTIPDCSGMLEKVRIEEERKFVMPITTHVGLLLVLIFMLLISSNVILLWISGVGVVTLLALLAILLQKRHRDIERIVIAKQKEIDDWIANEQQLIQKEKEKHEHAEDERIKGIENLIAGDIGTIFAKIDQILTGTSFPFHVSADVAVYMNVAAVKIWLPPKSIIPTQICALQSSGRPSFQEKEMRTINKQYFELCAAVSIRVMSAIYAHIPSFRIGYVYGMSKEGTNTECLFTCKFDRQILEAACNAANGLAAMQVAKAIFNCDTSLTLLPIEVGDPEEWENIELQLVRNLHIDLFR